MIRMTVDRALKSTHPGRSKTPGLAAAGVELVCDFERDSFDFHDDELGDAVAAVYRKCLFPKVKHDDTDDAPVIGIYSPWRVQHTDAVFQCQPAAGPHLSLISGRDRHADAGGDQFDVPGIKRDGFIHCGNQVHAGSARRLVLGQAQVFAPGLFYNMYDNLFQ